MTGNSKFVKGLVVMVIIGMISCFWAPARASEDSVAKTLSPYFFVEGTDSTRDRMLLKSTDVSININGVIAEVVVRQVYTNEGDRPINAKYVFPASTRAAVNGMTMRIGDRLVTARIKEKEAAKKEFETAKATGKSASLLSQHRPNVFSMNVSNIMPKDRIEIELHYTELLVPTEGTYSFVYPTVVGPRYSNQAERTAPEDDKWVANPYLKQGNPGKATFNIGLSIATGMPVQQISCTSHLTKIEYDRHSSAKVTLDKKDQNGGNRDFILQYRLSGKKVQTGLMLFDGGSEKFFLLMVQPPEKIRDTDIPPREYIFVVDVSGSMYGYPLTVSKELLRGLIGKLRPTDRFNVVLFAGASQLMSPVSVPATKENIQAAITLIEQQRGGGGTELLTALNRAFAIPRNEAFSRTILLVTDGFIDAEKDVFSTIRNNLNRTNVFAFGIGLSVNRYLIEGVAKAGMGEPFIVPNEIQAPETVRRFADYVSKPVLTKIKLRLDGFAASDIESGSIPDLFADRPLVVIGKWSGNAAGTVTISGTSGHNEYSQTFRPAEVQPLASNSPLRYLWARERISRLSDFNFGSADENRDEITALGLKYNLLTKYTSFIAVHEIVRNKDGNASDITQPLPLPQGVSNLAVGGSNQVPEPDMTLLVIVLASFLLIMKLRALAFSRAEN